MSEKKIHTRGTLPPGGVPGVPETEITALFRVACDGGEGALGHPRVWLSIPEDRGWVECGYCDKRFVHADCAGAQGDDAARDAGPGSDSPDLPGRQGEGAHPGIP